MKFVHILPSKYINNEEFQTSDTILILAHLLKNKEYLKECKKFKGIKILDNSFYEMRINPYTVEELIKLAKKSNSQIICLPDTKYETKEEFEAKHYTMADEVKRAGFKVMAVVTSDENFKTELREFKILNSIRDIDIISIPYVLRDGMDQYRRWKFLDMIEQEVQIDNINKEIHLFGCNSFYNLKLERRSWVNSVDGTMPFKEGYFRQPLPCSIEQETKRPEDYFNIENLDEEQVKIIKHNIKVIKEICEGEEW